MNKHITVISIAEYEFPGNLLDVKDWVDHQLDKIPDQYQHTATLEIEGSRGYDDGISISIHVTYTRPETREEEAIREEATKQQHIDYYNREVARLDQMKKKLGID